MLSIILLLAAAFHDAAIRTIPNCIPAALVVVGLSLRIRDGNWLASLVLAFVILAPLAVLWLRGYLGGGDVKLIPAASFALPPSGIPAYILSVAVAGGVLALIYLALSLVVRRPLPGRRLGFLPRVLKAEAWRMHRRGPLPYAVAIAAGALPGILDSLHG